MSLPMTLVLHLVPLLTALVLAAVSHAANRVSKRHNGLPLLHANRDAKSLTNTALICVLLLLIFLLPTSHPQVWLLTKDQRKLGANRDVSQKANPVS